MKVMIDWQRIHNDGDKGWALHRVLYAYLDPNGLRVMYIGHVWDDLSSIRARFNAVDRPRLNADLREAYEFDLDECRVLAGKVVTPKATKSLLIDLELKLIAEISPWGNREARPKQGDRRGMLICNIGSDWPSAKYILDDK